MRLTGGEHRGRPIRVPRGGVRPTQDRVREALFSMVAPVVPGSRFLDLYAGSGAVGLEAVSRGAAAVVWVEQDAAVFRVLKDNVAQLAGADRPRDLCARRDVMAFLRSRPPAPFDIVYADPPYAAAADEGGGEPLCVRLLAALRCGAWLAPDGVVVIETAARADLARPPEGWDLLRARTYGKTALSLYKEQSS